MKQNIKQNHTKGIDTKLYSANYYDFMLFKGKTISSLNKTCVADFSDLDINDGILYSTVTWSNAINKGIELDNIGLTGIDNGLISYQKDKITNEQFLNVFLNSTLKIEANDNRLILNPITGNTQMYSYPMSLVEGKDDKYIAFKGGFYQGFFKSGENYQILPHKMESDWIVEFELRPRTDYLIETNMVNYNHKNNKGIFFFIGTRAENKFWPFYKMNENIINNLKKPNAFNDGYFIDNSIIQNDIIEKENDWILKEKEMPTNPDMYFNDEYLKNVYNNVFKPNIETFVLNNSNTPISFFDNGKTALNEYNFNSNNYCSCLVDESLDNEEIHGKCGDYFDFSEFDVNCPEVNNHKVFEEDYIGEGIIINDNNYSDSEGHKLNDHGFEEIETDNKFILFNRTSHGFTTNTWVEGTKGKIVNKKNLPNINYFTIMNHTETGYTTNTINEYNELHQIDFNPYNDIRDNVFCLRITDEGKIGYRYGVTNCDSENKYSVIEEYSKPNIIKSNEWNKIKIKFKLLNNKKMIILFYVNNYLVFISKELNKFNFKQLNEVLAKQETVPYNISLGGGSLGLMETILPNYYAISDYILPIEKDFCGTFMGDIKSFKIYI